MMFLLIILAIIQSSLAGPSFSCGSVSSEPNGSLSYSNAGPNLRCTFTIFASFPRSSGFATSILEVTFMTFETERNYDFLYLYGANSVARLRYSGSDIPPVFSTLDSEVHIEFTTDGSRDSPGWSLKWATKSAGEVRF